MWRLGAALALWAGLAQGASAQAAADVTWELIGRPLSGNAESLAFVNGAALDGSLDTLYASSGLDLVRLPPGGEWSENIHLSASTNVNLLVTSQGTLLAGYTYLQRSTDHGRTWDFVEGLQSVDDLLQSTLPALNGAVFVGGDRGIFRSDDDGQTWARIGNVGSPTPPGALVEALAEVPQSAALPDGCLLAAVQNGLAYSDDGGVTWTRSSVWNPFQYWGRDMVVARNEAHPYGGTVYASVTEFPVNHPAIYASDDGGATWERRHLFDAGAFGVTDSNWALLVVGPGGSLWAGIEDAPGRVYGGAMVVSGDGGRTWLDASVGLEGVKLGVKALFLGRDRRLYAATAGCYRDECPMGSVFRTRDPLIVAAEEPPSDGSQIGVSVRPNPAQDHATVTFTLPEAGRVRLAAVDITGAYHGGAQMGGHEATLDGSGLPAGTYLVRLSFAGQRSASARLVVAR